MHSAQNSSWHIVSAIYMLLLFIIIITTATSIRICTLPFSVGEIETRNCNNSFELYIMLVIIFCFD